MKLLTFEHSGHEQLGVLSADEKSIIALEELGFFLTDMNALIAWQEKNKLQQISAKIREGHFKPIPLENVHLSAPIPHPVRDVICMGLNYLDHAQEMADALEEKAQQRIWPIFFGKAVDRARGHGEAIPSHKDFISTLDYECELAAVLGRDVYQVKAEEVRDCIFGYTILNDITARELNRHKQNYFQKSLNGTCPMGPWLITADEISYPPDLSIRLWVNGELRQNGSTAQMLFNLDDIISTLSQGMTLPAGTIIATGSPTGIGFGMHPPVFLKDSDLIRCEIEGIGALCNIVKDDAK